MAIGQGQAVAVVRHLGEIKSKCPGPPGPTKETLENQGHSRDNGNVIASQDWGDGRQAAWLLGLRADDGEEADQTGEVSL